MSGSGPAGPGRRAIRHWTWRLFRGEWRQQVLIIAMIAVALAATVVGATVATNAPQPDNFGVGSADHALTFTPGAHLSSELASIAGAVGRDDVIENDTFSVPGSTTTFDLRAQDPRGAYGAPLLRLVSGHYPVGAHQVALSSPLASDLGLRVGQSFTDAGGARVIVGVVDNPLSLLDSFALVAPGQVAHPSQVVVLFDGSDHALRALHLSGASVQGRSSTSGQFGPGVIVVLAAAIGLSLIGLVSIAGFTVVAQRRLRSLGMIRALGATDRHVRQVVGTNGVLVGLIATALGAVLGAATWVAYRPHLIASNHHDVALLAVPWLPVGAALVLAFLTPVLASARPGRAVSRLAVVSALAARPAPPKNVTRTALPGLIIGAVAVLLLGDSASSHGSTLPLFLGFVALIVGVVLLAPTIISLGARAGRRAPLAARLALRDLGRYRARSASTMAAISIGVMVAMIVMLGTTARYANVLDYVGPNLTSTQLIVYAGQRGPNQSSTPTSPAAALAAQRSIAASLHVTHDVALVSTSADLDHNAAGRSYSGPLYVATPQLLAAFGVAASSLDAHADVLTMRPGFATTTEMLLVYGDYYHSQGKGGTTGPLSRVCPASSCVANPVMQTVSALPAGTSAPNTVVTEHAVSTLGLAASESTTGWLLVTARPITSAQVAAARQSAAAAGLSVESKNEAPTSSQVVGWATLAALLIALAMVAMSIGLIRAESADERRTLAATGASPFTLRTITAVSAGTLALLGALLGALGAYVAGAAIFAQQPETGSVVGDLTQIPATNLLIVFVGLPLIAALGGWLLAGREPSGVARAPA
ncbi:MAG: FtsX-like permease family protein [Acidimicrobiales bacterium]